MSGAAVPVTGGIAAGAHAHPSTGVLVEPVALPAGGSRRVLLAALATAAIAGLASAFGVVVAPERFGAAYLLGFAYLATVGVGSLFWILIHYLTGAGWSVVVRRLVENLAAVIPWLLVLFVPIALSLPTIYRWARGPAGLEGEALELLEHKEPWLNGPFFVGRGFAYLAIWALIAFAMRRWADRQDDPGRRDAGPWRSSRWWSPLSMIALAVTTSFAAFDWLMSLDYLWYSTIFGVYFWAGSILSSLAATTIFALVLRRAGWLTRTITIEHLHDLGKLMIGFTIFWSYIAFSQYFLIWYANLPEETLWFIARRTGSWNWVSWTLFGGHFLVPFALLLPYPSKRSPFMLGVAATWILLMHYVDLYWLILPEFTPGGVRPHWLDLAAPVAILAVGVAIVAMAAGSRPLVPVGDPRLGESLAFHNG